MNTFTPFRQPRTLSTEVKIQNKVNEFGDGYSHSVVDGINSRRYEITLEWNGLTFAQANTISTFFTNQNTESFYYTHPTTNEVLMWRCIEWNQSAESNHVTLSAKFEQTFN